jgi:predicted DNA-binding WGR domain protein
VTSMPNVTLYRIDPAKSMHRFYRLDIQRDLFGAYCVVKEWGRMGRSGQMRSTPYPTGDEAERAFQKQRGAKEKRGYAAA